MDIRDRIGKRGENLFAAIITRWCDDEAYFEETNLGGKHPSVDFLVDLADPTSGRPQFYVSVKATVGYAAKFRRSPVSSREGKMPDTEHARHRMRSKETMILHRSEALALVALTREIDVNPVRVDLGDIDFFAFLPGENPRDSFRFFGVIVKGTGKIGSVDAANSWGRSAEKSRRFSDTSYAFPTILLLCSMIDEIVYYSWVMEPNVGADPNVPGLRKHRKLDFDVFDRHALARVVKGVQEWYDAAIEITV